jgi:hypothetical protein
MLGSMADDLLGHFEASGAPGDLVDLYHHTHPESVESIYRDRRFEPGTDEDRVYFTNLPSGGSGESDYGSGVVHLRMPRHLVNDWGPDAHGEHYYDADPDDIRPEHFVEPAPQPHEAANQEGGEMPDRSGIWYRAHLRDQPLDEAHARSRPLRNVWKPGSGLVPSYGDDQYRGDRVNAEVGQRGYSSFGSPFHLAAYMHKFGWPSRPEETQFGDRDVIAFHGRRVGTGMDREPLVIPEPDHSCCGRVVHSRMSWDHFSAAVQERAGLPEHEYDDMLTNDKTPAGQSPWNAWKDTPEKKSIRRNQEKENRRRQAQATVGADLIGHFEGSAGTETWYHGTVRDLSPGGLIETGHPVTNSRAQDRLLENGDGNRLSTHVHATPSREIATGYAHRAVSHEKWNLRGTGRAPGAPRVYEVEWTGDHEADPDGGPDDRRSADPLRVVREVGMQHEAAHRPGRGEKTCACCNGEGSHGDGSECDPCDGSGMMHSNDPDVFCPGQPQPKRRHWREASAEGEEPKTYYHVSYERFPRGTMLTARGKGWSNFDSSSGEHVYMTDNEDNAERYRHLLWEQGYQEQHKYEVRPTGPVEPDPDDPEAVRTRHPVEVTWHSDDAPDWFEPKTGAALEDGMKHEASDDMSYRMQHQGPDADDGEGMHEIGSGKVYPADIHQHPEWYIGNNGPGSWESWGKASGSRGWPSRRVTMYRSLPSPHREVNAGDWVTSSAAYAREHGRQSNPDDDWPVVKFEARADQLRNAGDSINEWSYHGPKVNRALVHFSGGKNHRGKGPRGGKADAALHEHEPPEMYQAYSAQNSERRRRLKEEREAKQKELGDWSTGQREASMQADGADRSDYGMQHEPPGGPGDDCTSPMHDVRNMMPDAYEHPDWYGGADPESIRQIRGVEGKPEARINVYRALPHEHAAINTGDWVSTSAAYALRHGESNLRHEPRWSVIKSTVPAEHLFSEGNSLSEWGYQGPTIQGEHHSGPHVGYSHQQHEAAIQVEAAEAPEGHRATGDEDGHDMLWLTRHKMPDGTEQLSPGYGDEHLAGDLKGWHDDEEGGMRKAVERNDPRIDRWKRGHLGSAQAAPSVPVAEVVAHFEAGTGERVASRALDNPHTGGDEWYHGTQAYPGDLEHGFSDPMGDDENAWNARLGTHFTSDHELGKWFAKGEHNTRRDDEGWALLDDEEPNPSVVHARLRLSNPKVYASEHDMDHEAYEHEHAAGNHPSRDFPDDPEDREWDERERPGTYEIHREWGDGHIPAEAMSPFGTRNAGHPVRQLWLTSHPDAQGIASRFKARLQAQGHDGIVYGNAWEHGPAGMSAPSAIAFHPDQIDITRHHGDQEPCQPETPGHTAAASPAAVPDVIAHFAAAGPWMQQKLFHVKPDPTLNEPESRRHNPDDPDQHLHWRSKNDEDYEPDECEHCGGDLKADRKHAEQHRDWLTNQDWHTDWNEDSLPATLHRGIGVELPDEVHQRVHDESLPVHERARALTDHLLAGGSDSGRLGNFWSADPDVSKNYAESSARRYARGNDQTPVMFHIRTPAMEHIETDPDTLREWGVYSYHLAGNREVPIQHGAPLHVTGISWAPPRHGHIIDSTPEHLHEDPAWTHHDFGGDGEIRAQATAEIVAHFEEDDDEDPDDYSANDEWDEDAPPDRDEDEPEEEPVAHRNYRLPYVTRPPEGELIDHLHHMHGLDARTSDLHMNAKDRERWHNAEHQYKTNSTHQHDHPQGTPGEEHWPDVFELSEHTDFAGGTRGDWGRLPGRTAPFKPLRSSESVSLPTVTAAAGEHDELPPDPGTAPIPAGHVRLWHYTPLKNVPSIRAHGLQREFARGDSGDGDLTDPSAGMWASTKRPDDILGNHSGGAAVVEFHAHPGEISGNAESPWQAMRQDRTWDDDRVREWGEGYHHVIMRGDVHPSSIVAIHEPWHGSARYMRDDDPSLKSYDWVKEDYAKDPEANAHLEPYVRGLRALEQGPPTHHGAALQRTATPSFTWRYQTYDNDGNYADKQQEVSGPFYHGSRSKRLTPGGQVRPGMRTNGWGDEGDKSQFVHFTNDLDAARTYAQSAGGHVYEVEPTGEVRQGYGGGEWKSEHPLRVLRRVDNEGLPTATAAAVALTASAVPAGLPETPHPRTDEEMRAHLEGPHRLYAEDVEQDPWEQHYQDHTGYEPADHRHEQYYHGTSLGHPEEEDPPEQIVPQGRRRFYPGAHSGEHAFATTNKSTAWAYAGRAWHWRNSDQPRVLRVRPTGPFEDDPGAVMRGGGREHEEGAVQSRRPWAVTGEEEIPEEHLMDRGDDDEDGRTAALSATASDDDDDDWEEDPEPEEESYERVAPERDEHDFVWQRRRGRDSGIVENDPDEAPRCLNCSGADGEVHHYPEEGHRPEVQDRLDRQRAREDRWDRGEYDRTRYCGVNCEMSHAEDRARGIGVHHTFAEGEDEHDEPRALHGEMPQISGPHEAPVGRQSGNYEVRSPSAEHRCHYCRNILPQYRREASQHVAYDWATDEGPFTWGEIAQRHPRVYGDDEDHVPGMGEGGGHDIGDAAAELYHDRPSEPYSESTGELHPENNDEMEFHPRTVDPSRIDYMHAEPGDERVARARRGYESQTPERVPPVILVHRHGVFQVADGHHRAGGAAKARRPVRAYVAYSPHEDEPFAGRDGEPPAKGPFHGAEAEERPALPDQNGVPRRVSYPGFPHTAEVPRPTSHEAALVEHFEDRPGQIVYADVHDQVPAPAAAPGSFAWQSFPVPEDPEGLLEALREMPALVGVIREELWKLAVRLSDESPLHPSVIDMIFDMAASCQTAREDMGHLGIASPEGSWEEQGSGPKA